LGQFIGLVADLLVGLEEEGFGLGLEVGLFVELVVGFVVELLIIVKD